jgi:hypothetical protein
MPCLSDSLLDTVDVHSLAEAETGILPKAKMLCQMKRVEAMHASSQGAAARMKCEAALGKSRRKSKT